MKKISKKKRYNKNGFGIKKQMNQQSGKVVEQVPISDVHRQPNRQSGKVVEQVPISDVHRQPNQQSGKVVETVSINDIHRQSNFSKLPSQIFHPYRIMIMVVLKQFGALDFPALKNGIAINSDGNLANHLRVLEDFGIVQYRKEFVGKRPKTFYELTGKGKTELQTLLKHLEDLVDVGKHENS